MVSTLNNVKYIFKNEKLLFRSLKMNKNKRKEQSAELKPTGTYFYLNANPIS